MRQRCEEKSGSPGTRWRKLVRSLYSLSHKVPVTNRQLGKAWQAAGRLAGRRVG